jgi:hypothetical protein
MLEDEENDINCTPPYVTEAANSAVLNLLPLKSSKIYEKAYDEFLLWCKGKQVSKYVYGKCAFSFFGEKSKHYKPSTLWSHYSMLKVNLIVKNNVDISNFVN